jgi:hypothetical protein
VRKYRPMCDCVFAETSRACVIQFSDATNKSRYQYASPLAPLAGGHCDVQRHCTATFTSGEPRQIALLKACSYRFREHEKGKVLYFE